MHIPSFIHLQLKENLERGGEGRGEKGRGVKMLHTTYKQTDRQTDRHTDRHTDPVCLMKPAIVNYS